MNRTITLVFLLLIIITTINAQTTAEIDKFKTDVKQFYEDDTYDPEKFMHYKALNIIFNQEINKLLTEASDLSTRSAFATLEEEDNRLTLGYSISPDNTTTSGTDYVNTIWSMGIQADIEDNFSSLAVDNDIQNNIGVFVKFTKLFKGNIWYKDASKIQNFRDQYLLDEALQYKYKKYYESSEERALALQKKQSLDNTIDIEDEKNKVYINTVKKAYEETLKDEAETIKTGNYITGYRKILDIISCVYAG